MPPRGSVVAVVLDNLDAVAVITEDAAPGCPVSSGEDVIVATQHIPQVTRLPSLI
jgi:hypothetical protein